MTTIYDTVRKICLELPETEEIVSHGFPHFKVQGKGFATYSVNHHGDNKVALLLNIGRETQQMLVESAPDIFFVPPYTGPKGWVGIELNQGLRWSRVSLLTWEAYCRSTSTTLAKTTAPVKVSNPTERMSAEDINPMNSKKNQAILTRIRQFCLTLPEVSEDLQFGNPSFRAGKKAFCNLSAKGKLIKLQLWVGPDRQSSLSAIDERFSIPPYVGHRGWIDLDLSHSQVWSEVESLLVESYQHFALKRMLKALEENP